MFIPCQKCHSLLPKEWNWFICDTCGKRICMTCLGKTDINAKIVHSAITMKEINDFGS